MAEVADVGVGAVDCGGFSDDALALSVFAMEAAPPWVVVGGAASVAGVAGVQFFRDFCCGEEGLGAHCCLGHGGADVGVGFGVGGVADCVGAGRVLAQLDSVGCNAAFCWLR